MLNVHFSLARLLLKVFGELPDSCGLFQLTTSDEQRGTTVCETLMNFQKEFPKSTLNGWLSFWMLYIVKLYNVESLRLQFKP